MITTSRSQAGQDRFVDHVLDGMRDGLFVDCGCCHPVQLSNSFALEDELGWRGGLIDLDENAVNSCREYRSRKNLFFHEEATTADWTHILDAVSGNRNIDYLSLDCDGATPLTLAVILSGAKPRFRVLSVEHDAYRFGPEPRTAIVDLLAVHKYEILCADVCHEGMPFEVWAVDPGLVDMKRAEKFRRAGPTDWKEFFA